MVEEQFSSKKLRLEADLANPPTKKCLAILEILEEMLRRFPDQLRLDVYFAGQVIEVTPTMRYLAQCKIRRIPSAYVNGFLVAQQQVPDPDTVLKKIEEELAKGPEAWQA